jgi:hypothetical protein
MILRYGLYHRLAHRMHRLQRLQRLRTLQRLRGEGKHSLPVIMIVANWPAADMACFVLHLRHTYQGSKLGE